MACPHHPDTAYVVKDGKLVCPECGYVAPYQLVPNEDDLLVENAKLRMRVYELEKFLEEFAEYGNGEKDFMRYAKRLLKQKL